MVFGSGDWTHLCDGVRDFVGRSSTLPGEDQKQNLFFLANGALVTCVTRFEMVDDKPKRCQEINWLGSSSL